MYDCMKLYQYCLICLQYNIIQIRTSTNAMAASRPPASSIQVTSVKIIYCQNSSNIISLNHYCYYHCSDTSPSLSWRCRTPCSPCRARDKWLPAKEPLGVMKFGRFSFFASYLQIWEIYLNIKEIYELKVTKENRKSSKFHYSQWLISWQRFVLHMLRMRHGVVGEWGPGSPLKQ